MYMILWWKDEDSYLDYVKNKDGSITLFETLKEADAFANKSEYSEDMRVISIEGVHTE